MKTLLSISLVAVFSLATLAFTVPNTSSTVEPVKSEKNELTVNEESLYCSVVIDGQRHTCWLCDCEAFITALKK